MSQPVNHLNIYLFVFKFNQGYDIWYMYATFE